MAGDTAKGLTLDNKLDFTTTTTTGAHFNLHDQNYILGASLYSVVRRSPVRKR
jgi:hypothetical protein